jgi:hypothetical protein
MTQNNIERQRLKHKILVSLWSNLRFNSLETEFFGVMFYSECGSASRMTNTIKFKLQTIQLSPTLIAAN